jgi:hypothetical protein
MAYLDIHFTDMDALTSALDDIKYSIEDGNTHGSGEYFGTIVAWKLNLNAR